MRDEMLAFIKEVQAISHIGQQYSQDPFARDNYEQLAKQAQQMLHDYSGQTIAPVDVYVDFEYPTPQPAVRTLLINEHGQLLFVQERDSGKWSLPGGWVDVNSSPAKAAVKEVFEESGYECELERLVAIYDRNQYLGVQALYDVLCFYFVGRVCGGQPRPNHETSAVAWFALEALPPLSPKNTAAEIKHAYMLWHTQAPTHCD